MKPPYFDSGIRGTITLRVLWLCILCSAFTRGTNERRLLA